MRTRFLALAAVLAAGWLFLTAAPAAAQYYGGGYYPKTTYAQTYATGYGYSGYAGGYSAYSYPGYSYWPGGWEGYGEARLWYPAGWYAKVNGLWYRRDHGYTAGLTYDPYAQKAHCDYPAAAAPQVIVIGGPREEGAAGGLSPGEMAALRRLLAAADEPKAARPIVIREAPREAAADPGLSPADLAALRKILTAARAAPKVVPADE